MFSFFYLYNLFFEPASYCTYGYIAGTAGLRLRELSHCTRWTKILRNVKKISTLESRTIYRPIKIPFFTSSLPRPAPPRPPVVMRMISKDVKLDVGRDESLSGAVNEIAEIKSCNSCVFLECRKKTDLYLWAGKTPNGPSVK